MAKKKPAEVPAEVNPMTSVLAEIDREYGVGVVRSGSALVDRPKQMIPMSPALDVGLGGGVPEGSWVSLSGVEKGGKAQPDDATVMTPSGPARMGDIKVGDAVCTPTGTARVRGVYPQGEKDVFRVVFINGDAVECCDDHLWLVQPIGKTTSVVKPLRDFRHKLRAGDKCNWSVKLPEPVAFDGRDVPIDPYLLGVLLGDGCFRRGTISVTIVDDEIMESVKTELAKSFPGVSVTPASSRRAGIDYRLSKGNRPKIQNGCLTAIRLLGLAGCGSRLKRVPSVYLVNSPAVRWAMIQGLMDTDGGADVSGRCRFYTSSAGLAEDFKFLVGSVGGVCTIRPRKTTYNGKVFYSFVCSIRHPDCGQLFRLSRKKNRTRVRTKGQLRRNIMAVEPVGRKSCRCIELDSVEGLYLTDHFVATHNTVTALTFAANAQRPENGSRPVMFLSVEHRLKRRDLLGIKGLKYDEPHFYFVESVKGRVLNSQDFLNIGEMFLKSVPGGILIIDSVSALVSPKVMTDGIGTADFGAANKIISQFCALNASTVKVNDNVVVGIVQFYANTSGYGQKHIEKAAAAWKYQADVVMQLKRFAPWTVGGDKGEQVGQTIEWFIKTSAEGKPGGTVESHLRYGTGIDQDYELFVMACAYGFVSGKGWYRFDFLDGRPALLADTAFEGKGEVKVQGQENAFAELCAHAEWVAALRADMAPFWGGTNAVPPEGA